MRWHSPGLMRGCSASCLFERFLAALRSQRSADQPSSKGSRYGLSCRAGWRGQHAMAPRHRDMARCSRHAATHPLFGFFSCSRRCACRCPRASPVVPLTMPNRIARSITHVYASCVMRSSAHPLMRWRHSGVGGWRGLSGQKIAWALIWFVEASRLHGGKRLRPTAHGARPPLAWPPCNPTGPRHFG